MGIPPCRGNDNRDGEDLMLLLESQLSNSFSALRKGAFGTYAESADLKSEDPLRERTPGSSPRDEGQPETLPEALALLAHARGRIQELEAAHEEAMKELRKRDAEIARLSNSSSTGDVGGPYQGNSSATAPKPVKLKVSIISATGLRAADLSGKSDPFCTCQAKDAKFQTPVLKKTLSPQWNHVQTIEVQPDILGTLPALKFAVFDKDLVGSDDLLGKAELTQDEYLEGYEGTLTLTNAGKAATNEVATLTVAVEEASD